MLRLSDSFYKIIVTAAGHTEESAHDGYRILVSVTIDHCIFYLWPHFLSVERRKSRNSLFSIRSRSTSFCISCFGGCPSFRGRPLAFAGRSSSCILPRRLYRFTHPLICSFSSPSSSAISCRVKPASRIAIICVSINLICVYFLFDITLPPDVIILHQGVFCLLSVFNGSVHGEPGVSSCQYEISKSPDTWRPPSWRHGCSIPPTPSSYRPGTGRRCGGPGRTG